MLRGAARHGFKFTLTMVAYNLIRLLSSSPRQAELAHRLQTDRPAPETPPAEHKFGVRFALSPTDETYFCVEF